MSDEIPIREYEQAVYVYWYGPTLSSVKIGHSNDPDRRLAQLGNDTGVPDHLASFAAIVWLDRKREKVEARAHEMAAIFRRSGEWFEITASQALNYIVDAAKELNIRYEVEDRASLLLRSAEEQYSFEKWGPNWKAKEATEEETEAAAVKAEETAESALGLASAARAVTSVSDNFSSEAFAAQRAEKLAEAAAAAAVSARRVANVAANDTTAQYRERMAKLEAEMVKRAVYRSANPVISPEEQAVKDEVSRLESVVA
ncbi:MAG: hypothetical protein RIS34_1167, partial [Pseudomonadota bacterium]